MIRTSLALVLSCCAGTLFAHPGHEGLMDGHSHPFLAWAPAIGAGILAVGIALAVRAIRARLHLGQPQDEG